VVNGDLQPDLKEVIKFGADADEVLFLFDETIANHLAELVKKALQLRAVSLTLKKGFTEAAAKEEIALSTWFYEQFEQTRKKFAPFLRVAS